MMPISFALSSVESSLVLTVTIFESSMVEITALVPSSALIFASSDVFISEGSASSMVKVVAVPPEKSRP